MSSLLIGLAALLSGASTPTQAPWCGPTKITGYLRTAFSSHTWDGTPIWTEERIVAASWDVRMGSTVEIEGLGEFRVADRGGGLGNGSPMPWVDIAVWTLNEAYELTGVRHACFW
jgi:hypothetical protein